jgi:ketosteroid isomerase-like protein
VHIPSMLIAAAGTVAARAALPHVLRLKLRHDLARLNAGDHRALLAGFADDAVLHFHRGAHRWSGSHVGKGAIERFLQDFVAAGLHGELVRIWISGPPWALQLCVRFDDHAHGPDGEQIYANRVIIWARTRWGKIVEQRDFYEDTARITELEARLQDLGVLGPRDSRAGAE